MRLTQELKGKSGRLLLALFVGLSFGSSLYNFFLIRIYPPTSRRVPILALAACLTSALVYFWITDRWLMPVWKSLKFRRRLSLLAAGTLLGTYLLVAGTNALKSAPEVFLLLAPEQTLEIRVPSEQAQLNPEIIILYFSTDGGDISFDSAETRGWQKTGARLQLTNLQDNSFQWTGKTGEKAVLVFARSPSSGAVEISWNGETEIIDLKHNKEDRLFYNAQFHVPFYATKEIVLSLAALSLIAILIPASIMLWTRREAITQSLADAFQSSRPAVRDKGLDQRGKESLQKFALILVIMLLALIPRALLLGREIFYIDELSHLTAAKEILAGSSPDSVYQRSFYTVTLPVALFIKVFGTQLWAAKLPGVLFNVFAIIPLFLILDKVNRTAAVVACLLYASNPWIIGVARSVREYAYYPFYFFWIIYGMISLIESIPKGFVVSKHWKQIANWKFAGLFLVLHLPLAYAVELDSSSTFKIIGVAYLVFYLISWVRIDLTWKSNRLLLGASLIAICSVIAIFLSSRGIFRDIDLNLYPLRYFFPNAAQQIFFDRLGVFFAAALVAAFVLSVLFIRRNFIPAFLTALFILSGVFVSIFWARYFRPRYFISLQFWYIALQGVGLAGMWIITQQWFKPRRGIGWAATILILGLSINPRQMFWPATATESGERTLVTEEIQYDIQAIEEMLLKEAIEGELVISNIYGSYAAWKGFPNLEYLRPPSNLAEAPRAEDLRRYVYSWVESRDTGWIILDAWRRWRGLPRETIVLDGKVVDFVGQIQGQLVWRWVPSD
ncbi:MAG: ArnT family glycosyltransferase [Anaerolineales bacterium]